MNESETSPESEKHYRAIMTAYQRRRCGSDLAHADRSVSGNLRTESQQPLLAESHRSAGFDPSETFATGRFAASEIAGFGVPLVAHPDQRFLRGPRILRSIY
jgi:hypothetical protein